MSLIDKIKAVVKDGVDIAEIEAEINGLNPLNTVTDKKTAWDFIKSNDLLLSVLDQKVNERADTALDNFKSGKMKDLIDSEKEALRKELIPEETSEQKRIRELEEKIKSGEQAELKRQLEDQLLIKAKDLDFDPVKAKDYSIYGERAIEKLESDANWFNSAIESKLGEKLKLNYSGIKQPKVKIPTSGLGDLSNNELNALAMSNPEMKAEILSEIQRRTRNK